MAVFGCLFCNENPFRVAYSPYSLYIYSCPAGFKRIPIYPKQGFNSATPSISIITLNRGLYICHQTIYFVLSLLLFNLTRIYTRYIKETREILTHTHVIDCICSLYIQATEHTTCVSICLNQAHIYSTNVKFVSASRLDLPNFFMRWPFFCMPLWSRYTSFRKEKNKKNKKKK